jgi:hypothetical protein
MKIKWQKKVNGGGFLSACGRFEIIRHIRRSGIEWSLIDRLVPVEHGVSGARRLLSDVKDAAEWRLANKPEIPDAPERI